MTHRFSLPRRQVLRAGGVLGTAMALQGALIRRAGAADAIRIGDLMSYARVAAAGTPYRKGWEMALDEINGAGGVLGRKVEFISRDDGGTPSDALRVAEELVLRENVDLLTGTTLSNVAVAVADFAKEHKKPFIIAECLSDSIELEKGNRYTIRWGMGTYTMTATMFPLAKKTGAKRWALVVPNYEYGQSAAKAFKELLAQEMPDAQIVAEQYPPLGKIDAGATVQALLAAKPDAVFNAMYSPDLDRFIREARSRGLMDGRPFFSLSTGSPEWLDPMKDEAPVGWVVTGYPWYAADNKENVDFVKAYRARYNEPPRRHSTIGYSTLKAAAALVAKAGSTDSEALVKAIDGLQFSSPYGTVTVRGIDNQGDTGVWIGTIALRDGQGYMKDVQYIPGGPYLFPPDVVKKLRPAG
jgi:branched-chain amino acid transport system substrate-binding protein